MFRRLLLPAFVLLIPAAAHAQTAPMSVRDVLSAPFMNQLTAAPAKNRVAWFVDDEGRRNVWVASPTERARAVTHYTEDDGQDIDNIAWSPDGERLAYTRGTGPDGSEHPTAANPAHLQEDVKQRVEIATVSGDVRVVGEGHASVFSVDGKRLFFLRHGQIWSASVADASAAPEQLVMAHGSASALRPSPDGLKLAFVSHREDHSFIGVFTLASGNRDQGTGNRVSLTYVDPGTGLDHDPVWSPDSKRIAFIRESPVLTELDLRWMQSVPVPWTIRIAEAASGEGKQVWAADKGTGSLFHEMVSKNQLLWMADGRIVFPWEKTGWLHLYSLAPGAKSPQLLTPGEFEVDNVVSDGERIVYSSNQVTSDPNDVDRKHLWSLDDADSSPELQLATTTIETNPALLSSGSMTFLQGSSTEPFMPWLLNVSAKDTCKERGLKHQSTANCTGIAFSIELGSLTSGFSSTRFPGRHFIAPTQVVFPATDGLQIHAQLFLPKNAKPTDKLPTVVFFHGGSRRQMLLGYNPMQYYAQAYEFNQLLANHGYAVLSVNYRSGIGYGMAFRQAKNYGVFGGSEYLDIEGAVKWLKAQTFVDAKRIGAWGGSYGGYLTALALARDSADFAAGVDLHGVHDWSYEMGSWKATDDPAYNATERARVAYAASPMADIAKWKSPVLLMQGDDDRNVMFGQTVRLAAALRAQGTPVEEKIFPDEVHDFLLHRDWIDAYTAALEFFDRRLK